MMGSSGLMGFCRSSKGLEAEGHQGYEQFWGLAGAASDTRDMPKISPRRWPLFALASVARLPFGEPITNRPFFYRLHKQRNPLKHRRQTALQPLVYNRPLRVASGAVSVLHYAFLGSSSFAMIFRLAAPGLKDDKHH